MTIYYSPSTRGFYDDSVNTNIPEDKIEVSQSKYESLIADQSKGYSIGVNDKGVVVSIPPAPPTKQQTIAIYEAAAQENLDSVAQSWGYNSMNTAVTYANSTNAQFKADAEALLAWRDKYWLKAYTIEEGNLPKSAEDFVKLLPAAPSKPVI